MQIENLIRRAPEICGLNYLDARRIGERNVLIFQHEIQNAKSVFSANEKDLVDIFNRFKVGMFSVGFLNIRGWFKLQYIKRLFAYAIACHYRVKHGYKYPQEDGLRKWLEARERKNQDVKALYSIQSAATGAGWD